MVLKILIVIAFLAGASKTNPARDRHIMNMINRYEKENRELRQQLQTCRNLLKIQNYGPLPVEPAGDFNKQR